MPGRFSDSSRLCTVVLVTSESVCVGVQGDWQGQSVPERFSSITVVLVTSESVSVGVQVG